MEYKRDKFKKIDVKIQEWVKSRCDRVSKSMRRYLYKVLRNINEIPLRYFGFKFLGQHLRGQSYKPDDTSKDEILHFPKHKTMDY